jgi:hypothetical protein
MAIENISLPKKVRRMLGLSLDDWNNILLWFLGVAAFAAVFIGISTYATVRLAKLEAKDANDALERYKFEAAEKIATAKALGEKANAEAAEARKQTALLEKESSALEADNLALQTSLRPRRLSFIGWTDHPERDAAANQELKKFSGTVSFIQVVPDFEAQMFSRDVASVLEQAGWKPQFVNEVPHDGNELLGGHIDIYAFGW